MLKRLSQEKLDQVLDAGIEAFAAQGIHGASMAAIAREAGLSVGVLYKYYANKEDFFQACLLRSLEALEQVLREVTAREDKLLNYAACIIRALQDYAKTHGSHIRMYHQITTAGGEHARQLAEEIEGVTARLYTEFIARGQAHGDLRQDLDPRFFAFFFDNLLMMLQFSYCCDYYRARFALYCGDDRENPRLVEEELLKFLESAFTLERSAIIHREQQGGEPQ